MGYVARTQFLLHAPINSRAPDLARPHGAWGLRRSLHLPGSLGPREQQTGPRSSRAILLLRRARETKAWRRAADIPAAFRWPAHLPISQACADKRPFPTELAKPNDRCARAPSFWCYALGPTALCFGQPAKSGSILRPIDRSSHSLSCASSHRNSITPIRPPLALAGIRRETSAASVCRCWYFAARGDNSPSTSIHPGSTNSAPWRNGNFDLPAIRPVRISYARNPSNAILPKHTTTRNLLSRDISASNHAAQLLCSPGVGLFPGGAQRTTALIHKSFSFMPSSRATRKRLRSKARII